MSNIPKSNKNASFVTMKTVTFKLEVQKNTCLALIIQIMKLKQICFKKKSSRELISSTSYSSIQSYFKINLDLAMLFNVYFLYRKSWTFWATGPL